MFKPRALPRAFSTPFRNPTFRTTFARRAQSTAAPEQHAAESGFAKFWNSPVGPKTVHFWAPIMKWGVVLAGVADFARPAESLSLSQNGALIATGAIWTRWCFIIKPRNLFLATVNFFLFTVGAIQCSRILLYRQSAKGQADSAASKAKDAAGDAKAAVEKAVKN